MSDARVTDRLQPGEQGQLREWRKSHQDGADGALEGARVHEPAGQTCHSRGVGQERAGDEEEKQARDELAEAPDELRWDRG